VNAPADLADLRHRAAAPAAASGALATAPDVPDYSVDLTTARGFALAQRLAMALSTSTAVPAPFRAIALKRERRGSDWVDVEVENPASVGNCLVAIDTARSIGMSIIGVMQNADIIEGKLRWSGKFKIAVVNSSGRFTELDFQFTRRGRTVVAYKEKGEYDRDSRGYRFHDKTIEVDDVACVATSERIVDGKRSGKIVEGPEVSIRMAVEEGWYTKSGSKWQGALRDMMLMYRAGSYFADVYAPDLVMGMGMTAEEARDVAEVVDVTAAGPKTMRTEVPPVSGVAERVDTPAATPAPAPAEPPPSQPTAAAEAAREVGTERAAANDADGQTRAPAPPQRSAGPQRRTQPSRPINVE